MRQEPFRTKREAIPHRQVFLVSPDDFEIFNRSGCKFPAALTAAIA